MMTTVPLGHGVRTAAKLMINADGTRKTRLGACPRVAGRAQHQYRDGSMRTQSGYTAVTRHKKTKRVTSKNAVTL